MFEIVATQTIGGKDYRLVKVDGKHRVERAVTTGWIPYEYISDGRDAKEFWDAFFADLST